MPQMMLQSKLQSNKKKKEHTIEAGYRPTKGAAAWKMERSSKMEFDTDAFPNVTGMM